MSVYIENVIFTHYNHPVHKLYKKKRFLCYRYACLIRKTFSESYNRVYLICSKHLNPVKPDPWNVCLICTWVHFYCTFSFFIILSFFLPKLSYKGLQCVGGIRTVWELLNWEKEMNMRDSHVRKTKSSLGELSQ